MTLHPDAAAFLEELPLLGLPPSSGAGPEAMRQRYRTLCAHYAGDTAPCERVVDVPGPVPMRVYGEGSKTLVWYHGGRMITGDLETHDGLCRRLARATGRRVVAVHYRRGPEHPFPAAIEDAVAAARCQDGDVALGGDSAGAALALLAALEPGISAEALLLVYPMLDATRSLPSHETYRNGPGTSSLDIAEGYRLWLPAGADARNPRISPLFAGGLERLPRTWVLTVEHDSLRDEGVELATRLRQARVPVIHAHYAGLIHGFLTFPARFAAAGQAVEEMVGFLAA
jgi:acetyl esterase